jgi:hypothetical protein
LQDDVIVGEHNLAVSVFKIRVIQKELPVTFIHMLYYFCVLRVAGESCQQQYQDWGPDQFSLHFLLPLYAACLATFAFGHFQPSTMPQPEASERLILGA